MAEMFESSLVLILSILSSFLFLLAQFHFHSTLVLACFLNLVQSEKAQYVVKNIIYYETTEYSNYIKI